MNTNKPYLIKLNKITNKGGDLSFIDEDIPFDIKRLYWIYNIEKGVERGGHAHKNSDRILICLSKSIKVELENTKGEKVIFELNKPSEGLFFPKQYWVNMVFEPGAILLVIAASTYDKDEYISAYSEFINQ